MSKKLATRILTGIATVAVAGSMVFASPASAQPVGGSTQKKGCTDPDGGSKDLPHGTVWTSTTQNGQVASTYKCNDGTWERQPDKATVRPSRASRVGGTAVLASR